MMPVHLFRHSTTHWTVAALAALGIAVGVTGAMRQAPPDFAAFDRIAVKKAAFFGYFRPLVTQENRRLTRLRQRIKHLHARFREHRALSVYAEGMLEAMATRYRSPVTELDQDGFFEHLLRRVDIVPRSLALAQAANESAWGTSRFARRAHNYFGQWCFVEGCGLVPARRSAGARHEVADFPTPGASVRAYFKNLNVHRAYAELRAMRARLRRDGETVTGQQLATALESYSERGEEYVAEIRAMIAQNDLGTAGRG